MFDSLIEQLKANNNAESSALLLVNAMIARIATAGINPNEVKALIDGLNAQKNEIAQAVVTGTPGDVRKDFDVPEGANVETTVKKTEVTTVGAKK